MNSKRALNDKGVEVFHNDSSEFLEAKNRWYGIKEAVELSNEIGEDLAKYSKLYQYEEFVHKTISEYSFREYVNKKIKPDIYMPGIGIPKVIEDKNDTGPGKKRKLYNFAMVAAVVDPYNYQNESMYQKIIPELEAVEYFYDNNWSDNINGPLDRILIDYDLDKRARQAIIDEIKLLIDDAFIKKNSALSGQNRLLIKQNHDLNERYIHYHKLYNQISDKFQVIDKIQYDIKEEVKNQGDFFNEHILLSMRAITKKLEDISSQIN